MSPRVLIAGFASCLLAVGCYTPPDGTEARTPTAKLQRVFASDLSIAGWQHRSEGFSRLGPALGAEAARVERFAPSVGSMTTGFTTDATDLPDGIAQLVGAEVGHLQRAQVPAQLRPSADRWAGQVADCLALLPVMFGFDRRMLGEPSDREHRTDPHDDRPEATLWQRLSRRLGL